MGGADRKKRCAVTAKRNELAKTQKATAKNRKLKQGAWVAEFAGVEEEDESEDEEEDGDDDDIIDDHGEMEDDADDEDEF